MGALTTLGKMAAQALGDAPRTADELLSATPAVAPMRSPVAPLKAVKQMGNSGATVKVDSFNLDDVELPMGRMAADDPNAQAYDDIGNFKGEDLLAFDEEELDSFGNLKPTEAQVTMEQQQAATTEVIKTDWAAQFAQDFKIDPKSNDMQKIMDFYVGSDKIKGKSDDAYRSMFKNVASNIEAGRFLKNNYMADINFDSAFKLDDGTPMVFWRGLVESPSMVKSGRDVYSFRMDNPDEIGTHFGTYDQAAEFSYTAGKNDTPLSAVEKVVEGGKGLLTDPTGKYNYSYLAPVIVNMKNPLKLNVDIGRFSVTNLLRFVNNGIRTDEFGEGVADIAKEVEQLGKTKKLLDDNGKIYGDTVDEVSSNNTKLEKLMQDVIEAKGYDGVQYFNSNEGTSVKPSLIAFRKEQIITLDELIPEVKNYNKKQKEMFYSMVGLGVGIDVALKVMGANNREKQ